VLVQVGVVLLMFDFCVICVATTVPRADHALAMAKFARDMLQRMNTLTKELEVCLGPDTGDLKLRIGRHCSWWLAPSFSVHSSHGTHTTCLNRNSLRSGDSWSAPW